MELKLVPIECCAQCRFRREYVDSKISRRVIVVCRRAKQILEFENRGGYKSFPNWCPLQSEYCEEQAAWTEPQVATSQSGGCVKTMPNLEWAPSNLAGHGGTEVNGRWYYTWDQAMAAAAELGDGWRLPTQEELQQLCNAGSTWVDEGPDGEPGRWFGGNHDTDHDGSIFFPATGYVGAYSGALTLVGSYGNYWSSSPYSEASDIAGHLYFYSGRVVRVDGTNRARGFSVRCVRETR